METTDQRAMTGRRVRLRRFTRDDAAALHAYLSREEAVRFEPYGVMTRHECEDLAIARAADDRFLAVCLGDGTLIGNLYAAIEGPQAWRTWEVGYVMNPDHWGHGYATDALKVLLAHLFGPRGAHRVIARCDPRNVRSWRLLERVGMRREAHLRQAASFRNAPDGRPVWHDTYQYALLVEEWPPSAAA